ncbi:MAG: UDP-2,3-diacylglucosamine diphosphatase [Polaromonas sp.]
MCAYEELTAEPLWQSIDFISDLHLQASEPETFNAWQRYMQTTPADAVFILGDLFEVWVGDDVLNEHGFDDQCAHVIQQTGARMPVFFMHGNRDFLIGPGLMAACNTTLLVDPTVLSFNQQRWLLSHGDALCLDDADYMQFRQQVRSTDWQQTFLAKPLAERQAIARGLRQQSEARKDSGATYADVDAQAARLWLEQANSPTLIHGHTHKPASHDLGQGLQRVVLSDWDMAATPPRAEVLRLSAQGLQRIALT